MQVERSTTPNFPFRLAAAFIALASLSACAETGTMPQSTSMHLGAAAFAPQGYLHFCERRPDQCGLPTPIADADRAKLERVLNQQQWANVLKLTPTSVSPHDSPASASADIEAAKPATLDPRPIADDLFSLSALSTTGPQAAPVSATGELVASAPTNPSTNEPGKRALHLTPLVWAALNGVNQSINAKIRPMTDEAAFGVSDYWTLPLSDGPRPVGNCKHYALEKRKALVDAGFSADALSIAIVKTGWGEVHAVLIVGTDQGDYVLDNLTPWIKGWQEVRYDWIERQTPGEPLRWATVAAVSTPEYRSS